MRSNLIVLHLKHANGIKGLQYFFYIYICIYIITNRKLRVSGYKVFRGEVISCSVVRVVSKQTAWNKERN